VVPEKHLAQHRSTEARRGNTNRYLARCHNPHHKRVQAATLFPGELIKAKRWRVALRGRPAASLAHKATDCAHSGRSKRDQ
jgi:hypothetical protein